MRKQTENQDIFELAAAIVSSAADLNTFLKERISQTLSFANPAPVIATSPENSAYHEARGRCIEAAERLVELVRGPRDVLVELSFQVRLCSSGSSSYQVWHKVGSQANVGRPSIAHQLPCS